MIRLKYKKISTTLPKAKCWFCEASTNHALFCIDGSEIWCCGKCHKKHGRVQRNRRLKPDAKSYKKIQFNEGKMTEKGVSVIGSNTSKTDYIDKDKLNCISCNRFVSEINKKGFCPECEENEND